MRHEKQYQKRGRILVLYFLFICLVIPGPVFHAEESFPEETTEVLTEESLAEESIPEEGAEEALPDEEAQIEEPEEELPEEDAVEEEQTEEEPAEEEPQEEAPATETQLIEVASAEEAAAALAELSEEDTDSRLVVFGDTLPEETGANSVIYYEEYDEYILQFDSAEAAAEAQETLAETHDVYEDGVLTLDNLADNGMGNPDSYTWGTTAMGVDTYRDGSLDLSDTVTVAVIDTGVDPANPFFPAGVIRSDSRDMTVAEERALTDDNGHGTHVCGIIADMTPDEVQILALRVYDDNDKTSWSCILTAFQYCLEHDVDVINLSLGEYNTSTAPLDAVLQQAVAQDVVVVCAAGNDGRSPMYPSSLDTTIAVSAIRDSYQIWPSSNYGQAIDFCAPGVNIVSADRSTTEIRTVSKTGTSMAAPHIAAAFAYLKLADPGASWNALYEEAKAWSIDLGSTGWDEEYGWGYPELTGLFKDPLHIEDCAVSLEKTSLVYTGELLEPAVSLSYEGRTLAEDNEYTVSYSNNRSIGEATVTITGVRRFGGTLTHTFKIVPISMKNCKASLSQTSYTYTGKAKKPTATVKYNGKTLVKNVDYTVAYKNNKAIGKATVTITGKGNYTGSITKAFKILPAKVTQKTPVAGTKKVTVKYVTVKGGCRYQIAYRIKGTSTWKKVNTTLTTAKTIKKLKSGKKYQIKVRAYKKVDGYTYIGPWSDIKTVKVK